MMYLQEQFQRQRHYQLKLFNKYEITETLSNGLEKSNYQLTQQFISTNILQCFLIRFFHLTTRIDTPMSTWQLGSPDRK